MPGWDVREGRNGDTWLPGEFLAPSSWRRRSSARTGMRKPEQSGGVNKSHEYSNAQNTHTHTGPPSKEHSN